MVLTITFMADWGEIEQERQKEMARKNRRKRREKQRRDGKTSLQEDSRMKISQ
jgi:hypothetical protein